MIKSKLNNDSEKILVLVVTCSRSINRQLIESEALIQLAKIATLNQTRFDFVFFDNNSIFKEHLKIVQNIGVMCYASENRGLWSAIYWIIKNELNIFQHNHKYIHLVESDMFVKDLAPLVQLSQVLDQFSNLHMARTQEFSIKNAWYFNKKYNFLPSLFHNTRSEVDLKNTSDGLYFNAELIHKASNVDIYSSNLNAKLPGLHKMESLKLVFNSLVRNGSFSEKDFFNLYGRLSSRVGIIDKGIWYSLTDVKNNPEETASWGDTSYLKQIGYHETRYSVISDYKEKIAVSQANIPDGMN